MDVNGKHTVLPDIEGGLFQLHNILSLLEGAWAKHGELNEDFGFTMVVEYTDSTATKKFQTTVDLTYRLEQHQLAGLIALKGQHHSYEIIRLDRTTFKRLL